MKPSAERVELTFGEMQSLIELDEELGAQKKANLKSSIRTFLRACGRTERLMATFPEARACFAKINRATSGLSRSRLSNIKSDIRTVLERYGAPTRAPRRQDLLPEWEHVRALIDGKEKFRRALSRGMHFFSREQVLPVQVDNPATEAFLDHLVNQTVKDKPEKTHQHFCKIWNDACREIPGWPGKPVTVPSYRRRISLPKGSFPAAFWQDVEMYKAFIGGEDLFNADAINVPRKQSTQDGHESKLWRVASALVHAGHPIDDITGIKVLCRPANLERALRYYHDWLGGVKPSLFEIAAMMTVAARDYVKVNQADLERITNLRDRLKCRERGMTDKNRERLRPFLDLKIQYKWIGFADYLLGLAAKAQSEKRAALLVQTALIHDIMLIAPIRWTNLVGLHLDRHIRRLGDKHHPRIILSIPAE